MTKNPTQGRGASGGKEHGGCGSEASQRRRYDPHSDTLRHDAAGADAAVGCVQKVQAVKHHSGKTPQKPVAWWRGFTSATPSVHVWSVSSLRLTARRRAKNDR